VTAARHPAGGLALALLTGGGALAGCGQGAQPEARGTQTSAGPVAEEYHEHGPYLFRDATVGSGLESFRQTSGDPEKPFIVETVGGGVALFDADADGDLDAYLTNAGTLGVPLEHNPSDAFFANDGRARFEERTGPAGIDERRWTNGVRVADVDGDGWSDLYLTNYGPNVLYRNAQGSSFQDVSAAAGVDDPRWSTGACFLDFDRDGDLDLYVANYVDFDEQRMLSERPVTLYRGVNVMKGPQGLPAACDRFYVNQGELSFRDASRELGIEDELYGFQCVPFDFDLDGWIDVFVANDSVANLLWQNREGHGFEDVALRRGLAFSLSGRSQAGMGVALGDGDGDLLVDLYVTNFADDYSTLYRGEERGYYLDVTQAVGLAGPTMDKLAWGTGLEDFDSDGDAELYAVNGHVYPQVDRFRLGTEYRQPVQLFERWERGFREPDGRGGPGFAPRGAGRGAASGDVDGDGDLDLLIGNLDGPPRLLRNDGAQGNRVRLDLIGSGANRDAIGTRLVARSGGRAQLFLVTRATGFCSSSEATVHIGLGRAERLEVLELTWPDGKSERFEALEAGSRVVIERAPEGGPSRLWIAGPLLR
jgi:hypothetical protein